MGGCATREPSCIGFLGIPESETSGKGPVGLIGGRSCRVNDVTAVSETTYQHYQAAKQAGCILAEEARGDYVHYAIKTDRDVSFDNATAWVEVIERFRAKKP